MPTPSITLAVGIISPPPFRDRRDAIRQTWLSDLPPTTVAKFVVRNGSCPNVGPSRVPSKQHVEASDDIIPVNSICVDENRFRGAVLTIFAWLQHATTAYAHASFIMKTDDDVWVDLASLSLYAQHVANYGHTNVLMGPLWYTSWVEDDQAEVDMGFGYDCGQANTFYKRRIASWTNNNKVSNATSIGPYAFTPGYLTIISQHLAATLTASSQLQDHLHRKQTDGSKFGLEDKWLGGALSRYAGEQAVTYVNLYGALPLDTFGVQAHSTTVLWHNRVKDAMRIKWLHNFSRHYGCLAPSQASKRLPLAGMNCTKLPRHWPCAPQNSTICTIHGVLCNVVRYQLLFRDRKFQHWQRCSTSLGNVTRKGKRGCLWEDMDLSVI